MKTLAAALLAAIALAGAAAAQPAQMPVVESPASGPGDTLVVFYSGDGGWAALDRQVAAGLVARGFAVVGVDSLRYFLDRREPQAAAADLAAVIDRYSRTWNRPKVVLAGYSWGADILPLIVDRLPAAMRARIKLVAMVSPDDTAELQFHLTDWIGRRAKDATPLAPALAGLKGLNTLCIYGEAEAKPACVGFAGLVDKTVRLPGAHHLQGHYDLIAATIVAGLKG